MSDTVSSSWSSRFLPLSTETTGAVPGSTVVTAGAGFGGHDADLAREQDAERREALDSGHDGGMGSRAASFVGAGGAFSMSLIVAG